VAAERLPGRLPGGGVPQPDGLVVTARDESAPLGTEGHTQHIAVVAVERLPDWLSGGGVPQSDCLVAAAGGDAGAVGAERYSRHLRRQVDELEQVTLCSQGCGILQKRFVEAG
jgi:hypothetical protein